jgi:hypothetical protein
MINTARLLEVNALPNQSLHLRYADGVEGVVDLSHLVGRGVFAELSNPAVFSRVSLGPNGEVAWSDDLELCPDALYLRLTSSATAQAEPCAPAERVDAGR